MIRPVILYLSLCPMGFGCASPSGQPATPVSEERSMPVKEAERPTPANRFTGILRGGILAIGAETTGWVLETDDPGRVDVDVSKARDAADELEGQRVVIEGQMVTANWTERGEKRMLLAEDIRPAGDDEQ